MSYEVKVFANNEIVLRIGFDNYYQAENYIENIKNTDIETYEITDSFDEVLSNGNIPASNYPTREEILSEMFPDFYPERGY